MDYDLFVNQQPKQEKQLRLPAGGFIPLRSIRSCPRKTTGKNHRYKQKKEKGLQHLPQPKLS
ncbi:hypothetical protein O4H49_19260 [Kiloniella laminariae]|uniref:Transposase n=1 Tax=Kiloniella laminariae TaxID=454162 RepID=A0ABT4LPW3_9PROT|nr:hypothetical protein [Kiloniella laminariae]MCZ4282930.1 hypothetical protein [Kiloniella laminariae]